MAKAKAGLAWFQTMGRLSWFPGHMAKATREIKERLKAVDMVLEVRDARIPFSSGNPLLNELLGSKKRMVVLNKEDLCDPKLQKSVEREFGKHNVLAYHVDARTLDSVQNLLHEVDRWVREDRVGHDTCNLMVVGVPNCGKSTLINALHRLSKDAVQDQLGGANVIKANPAEVGPSPGVTRHQSSYRIGARPSIYIMDTPGVMVPRVADYETGLKLAITGCIKDSVVGEENMALYLLGRLVSFPREMRAAVATERQHGVDKGGSGPGGGHPAFHRMRRGKGPVANLERLLPVDDVAAEDLEWQMDAVLTELASKKELPEGAPLNINNDLDVHGKLIASQALIRLYRGGSLGQYTWDKVGADLDDDLSTSREVRDCTTSESISLYPESDLAPLERKAERKAERKLARRAKPGRRGSSDNR